MIVTLREQVSSLSADLQDERARHAGSRKRAALDREQLEADMKEKHRRHVLDIKKVRLVAFIEIFDLWAITFYPRKIVRIFMREGLSEITGLIYYVYDVNEIREKKLRMYITHALRKLDNNRQEMLF